MHNLVSVTQLQQQFESPDLLILDASVGTKAANIPEPACIPASVRFDFERQICDQQNPLPNTMPPISQFQQQLQQLGVNQQTQVVVYDNKGIYSSARAWWMLKMAGVQQVAVLDGGLPAWLKAGFSTESNYRSPQALGNFTCREEMLGFCDKTYLAQQLHQQSTYVLDARSNTRFQGLEQESRPGLRAGHIPGSINLPYASLQQDGHLLPQVELAEILSQFADKPLLLTCGSGVTACILALAATLCGRDDLIVYDGSWTEWGAQDSGMPVADNKH